MWVNGIATRGDPAATRQQHATRTVPSADGITNTSIVPGTSIAPPSTTTAPPPTTRASGPATAIIRGQPASRLVALTFDAGNTPTILRILARTHIQMAYEV
jgi:hypothetical protein